MNQRFNLGGTDFLIGGGELGALMRAHDWSTSPLGHPDSWPQSLRSVAGLILNSKFPMFVAWGPELAFLYNDAYRPVFGSKHPRALGLSFKEVWAEIWPDLEPLVRRALAGEATFNENLHLVMERNGFPEDTWYTFSYSPVRDESGRVAGLFCACTETTQQVLAERERSAESDRLRQLVEQAPGFVVVMRGLDHVFEIANQAFLELIGRDGIIGRPAREVLPELDGQGLFERLDEVFATGEPFVARGIPIDLRRKGGGGLEQRFLDFVYQPIRDEGGRVTGIFSQGNDITEARQAEAALRESEARFRGLFESELLGCTIFDARTGETLAINDRALAITGHTRADFLEGRWDWREFTLGDYAEADQEAIRQARTRGYWVTYEKEFLHRNGLRVPVRIASAPLPDRPGVVAISVQDLTEERQALAALRESEARFRGVFESELIGCMVFDAVTGETLAINGRMLAMTGHTREDFDQGRWDWREFTPPEQIALDNRAIAQAREIGAFPPYEKEYIHKSGRRFPARLASAPLAGQPGKIAISVQDLSEERAALSALRESEDHFRHTVELNPQVTWTARPDGQLDQVAKRWQDLTGTSGLGSTWGDAIHPEDLQPSFDAWGRSIGTGEPYDVEHRVRHKDRHYTWMRSRAFPRRDEAGRIVKWYGTTEDIHERKLAEAALRESEERFRNMADNAPVMVWTTDPYGSCTYLNSRWYEFTGQSLSEGLGLGWLDATHPDDKAMATEAFLSATARKEDFRVEYRLRRQDGVYRWALDAAAPRFASDGTFLGFVGTVIDITDRQEAEAAIRESEGSLRSLANTIPAFVWFAGPDGDLQYFNDRWYEFTSQTPEEALPNGWAAALHPDDLPRTLATWADARERGVLYQVETRYRRHDGSYRWYLARAEPMRDAAGRIVRWFGTSIDIDDQKRAEEHQRLLINELNHRVKNTLATVQSIASQTLRNAGSLPEAKEAFESRLLALSRAHNVLTQENWEGANLHAVVAQAIEPYRSFGDERLRTKGPAVRLLPRTALAIAMALQELATNAVKYGALSNEGGRVDIRWSVDRSPGVPRLHLVWEEGGGPPVQPPSRRGFGSRLIERSLASDLEGEVRIDFAPTGVVCTVDAPIE